MKMQEYYKVLGTTEWDVKYDAMNKNKPRTKEEQVEFLKMKYESQLRMIKIRQEAAKVQGNQNRLEELEREVQEVFFAYQKLKSEDLRKENHKEITKEKQVEEKITPIYKRKSPFEVLDINEEDIEGFTDGQIDGIIKKIRDDLIAQCSKELDSIPFALFSKRMKVERRLKEIEEAYERVSTADKRQECKEQEQKQKERKIRTDEYNPYLINDISNSDRKSLLGKIVRREEELSREYSYKDNENRQLRMKQTGVIKFQDSRGVGERCIGEYKITRVIDGREIVDTIYTNLPTIGLNIINEKTGDPIKPEYYDCFVNKLLAEDTIEASRSNGGFIGGIERDKEGKYYITLEKEELPPMEKDELAAVMIWKQREEEIKKEGEEQSK